MLCVCSCGGERRAGLLCRACVGASVAVPLFFYASLLSTQSGRQWTRSLSFFLVFTALRHWRVLRRSRRACVRVCFLLFFRSFLFQRARAPTIRQRSRATTASRDIAGIWGCWLSSPNLFFPPLLRVHAPALTVHPLFLTPLPEGVSAIVSRTSSAVCHLGACS